MTAYEGDLEFPENVPADCQPAVPIIRQTNTVREECALLVDKSVAPLLESGSLPPVWPWWLPLVDAIAARLQVVDGHTADSETVREYLLGIQNEHRRNELLAALARLEAAANRTAAETKRADWLYQDCDEKNRQIKAAEVERDAVREDLITVAEHFTTAIAAALAELAEFEKVLRELVVLKDGPRDNDYRDRKPLAWEAARAVLGERQ